MPNTPFVSSAPLRRTFCVAAAGAMLAVALPGAAQDPWPRKPIQVIVPVGPGAVHDLVIRALQPRLAKELGQQIIVVNKPGADWEIGTLAAKQSPADGHTWVMASIPTTANAVLKKVGYDPVKDFTAVANLGAVGGVMLVPPQLGVKSLADFVKLARSKPGQIAFGNAAVGSLGHINTALLEATEKIELNTIPYTSGQAQMLADLLDNRVNFAVLSPIVALPHIQAGKLVPLAITQPQRLALLPQVPTTVELGYPRLTIQAWSGMLMPAGVPPAIVKRANAALHAATADAEVVAQLQKQGVIIAPPSSPESFAQTIRDEMANWPKLFEVAKIKRQE
jgi:tripartite-type tricarboxylate transporter receptor subunit TctC